MTKKKAAPKVSDAERRYEKLLANNERLATNIAAARKTMAKRRRAVLDLANSAAHEPIGSEKGDLARKIIAEVGARVALEDALDMPMRFRTDPELAIADALERAAGVPFTAGRKVGSIAALRKRMDTLLQRSPDLTNEELWRAMQKKPPKGWEFFEQPSRYAMGPHGHNTGWKAFMNAAAKARKAIKSSS
ncbi:MAG: hypothetical protein KGJ54_06400 [Betaproteobacteria bacterium]|nr:hypothetical protein [Betaproteobacteria bacterium]